MRLRNVMVTDMRVFAAIALCAGLLPIELAQAHPMGNLSVNHYMRLEPVAKGVAATYVLDLAEIPTFELLQSWGVSRDAPRELLEAKVREQATGWGGALRFSENGRLLVAKLESSELAVVDGAGNLPVFRVTMRLVVPAAGGRLEYEDGNYSTRAGWREVVVRPGPGSEVAKASHGDVDLSSGLTSYPQDPTKAPPQSVKAWFEWKPVGGEVTAVRKPVVEATAALPSPIVPLPTVASPNSTEEVRGARPPEAQSAGTVQRNDAISKMLRVKDLSWAMVATLIALAFWFGALHALEPGHGKTMVAAYLVGERGTAKHAAILGGMVTFTHTISVFALGLATMFLSRYVMPEKISKVLGVASGVSIVWIGAVMLWRRVRALNIRGLNIRGLNIRGLNNGVVREHPHTHDHGHSHNHPHSHEHSHSHDHDGHTHSHLPEGKISMGSLIALGASGGLVPCPSALILLLGAISIGKVALGMVLLLSFSLGLAIVLMATGLLVLYAKNLLPEGTGQGSPFFRYMPVVSAAVILVIGIAMTGVAMGVIPAGSFIG